MLCGWLSASIHDLSVLLALNVHFVSLIFAYQSKVNNDGDDDRMMTVMMTMMNLLQVAFCNN